MQEVMHSVDAGKSSRLLAIAPAPSSGAGSSTLSANAVLLKSPMPYTCHMCAKRKIKCDKATPICSSCRRSKLECLYKERLPQRRKRKLSADLVERLARYERILNEHGLLEFGGLPITEENSAQEPISLRWNDPAHARTGKLLADQGRSRYVDGQPWRDLRDDAMGDMLDEEESDNETFDGLNHGSMTDPLTSAFMGHQQNILHCHPDHAAAMLMWETYTENVEPLCKVLHIPSATLMIKTISEEPTNASKTENCLLFAIYHFAVFSMTEEECMIKFEHFRSTLLQKYRAATRQALVNASFLKTTELSVLQALVLYLIPGRFFYDSHTYWILTGVAVRIGQRLGLHLDGAKLGLSPFEVEMRRRLFYRILPLDGGASLMSGTGLSIMVNTWDTQQPLNINDDQIWPGMTTVPEERKGATEMIFCLSRACVAQFLGRAGNSKEDTDSSQFNDYHEADLVINQAESEVEEKYIRYCDVVNPLHFLTAGLARSGITAMRLRVRLPKVRNRTATDAERKELLQFALRILDTDNATHTHPGLQKYRWHISSFFLWGTWESLIYVMTSLWQSCDLLSASEIGACWHSVKEIYHNHDELLNSKQALYMALGRLVLKAWDAHSSGSSKAEPAFITVLRSRGEVDSQGLARRRESFSEMHDVATTSISITQPQAPKVADIPISTSLGDMNFDTSLDSDFHWTDWMLWDQLIQDHQALGGQQED